MQNVWTMHPLDGAKARLIRAEKHIGDLKAEISTFFLSEPYEVVADKDHQTGQPFYKLTCLREIPVNAQILAGDAIYNIRSALDYLAYALATDKSSPNDIWFPIEGCADNYRSVVEKRIRCSRPEVVKAICEIEAHKDGRGHVFWALNKLNNIHKHRLLVAVYSGVYDYSITPSFRRKIKRTWEGDGPSVPEGHGFMRIERSPDEAFRPLQVGDKLFTDLPGSEIYDDMKFRFQIVFGESGIAEGDPLFETTVQMLSRVSDVVDRLGVFL